ncbi:MAG TPA: hypothetical protein VNA65_10990 [Candidatus Dormibacteraeota bacterium]|nr:hypothetical protein [Candidatus Dormibacteraeota bacterium]
MSRAVVRKVFVTGLVVWVVGAVLLALNVRSGQGQGATLAEAGLILVGIGGVIEVASWIMALISSAMLGRWGWFAVVLILGLIGLLLIVMIIYSLVGPSQRRDMRRPVVAT